MEKEEYSGVECSDGKLKERKHKNNKKNKMNKNNMESKYFVLQCKSFRTLGDVNSFPIKPDNK